MVVKKGFERKSDSELLSDANLLEGIKKTVVSWKEEDGKEMKSNYLSEEEIKAMDNDEKKAIANEVNELAIINFRSKEKILYHKGGKVNVEVDSNKMSLFSISMWTLGIVSLASLLVGAAWYFFIREEEDSDK